MENITVVQAWAMFLSAIAVFKAFEWIFQRFITPHFIKKQKEESIDNTLNEIKEKLDKDFAKLENHEVRIGKLESIANNALEEHNDLRETLKVIVIGQQAITKSILYEGDNREGLLKAEKMLDEYLHSRV